MIRGKVTGPKGQGIAEIEVSIVDRENRRVAGTWTDALGNYTMPALETGTYKIFFHSNLPDYFSQWYKDKTNLDAATEIAIMEGKIKDNIDACLAVAGKIRGSVLDEEGIPIAGINVEARSQSSKISGSGRQTDEKGNFAINGLPSGTYTLYVNPPETSRFLLQWYEKIQTEEGARPLNVSPGQESPWIVFRLQRKSP